MTNKPDFVHLHVHTQFSLLDGLSRIPQLVEKAKTLGQTAIAITDHGNLHGAIEFYKTCVEKEIKPIIGAEIYVARKDYTLKSFDNGNETDHLTVVAKDFEGYQNLMRLLSEASINGFYYRPRVDKKLLKKYSKGLIGLSGCMSSEVGRYLIDGLYDQAKAVLQEYQGIFEDNDFYIEVYNHEFDKYLPAHAVGSDIYNELLRLSQNTKKALEGLTKLSKELNIPAVATGDLHYIEPADAFAQDVLVCIQTGKTVNEVNRLRMVDAPVYYLKSGEEMAALFPDNPEFLANTVKIADKINIEIPLGQYHFPLFEVPGGKSPQEFLREESLRGLKQKIHPLDEKAMERFEYELKVIVDKGYSTYFLVVADFIRAAKKQGIVSTTRGSAAGSLVSYGLGITTVNPLYFKLPFERFLNPFRPSLPDIDVDIADSRRDDVINYVRQKYGSDKVAQIGTLGTMMAKGAVRDVARALGWPYSKADRISKLIPFGKQGFPMTIKKAIEITPELTDLYKTDTETKELLDTAMQIEGLARHTSVHAAGVVIAPAPVTNFTPLLKETKGEVISTQYDMHGVEDAGLVKMDFLGIRNLSILGNAVEIVQREKGVKIDLEKIPFDDTKAYEMMARGETMGLFQLGGSGMTRYLKELKPTNIFDIMAMISLFRPGPMASIPEFIERKHDQSKIKYFDPRMEEFLKESYGVITYQDDVLLTAINIAGYNWEEVDKFRKAIGKKIPEEMAKQKDKFIHGAIENGLSEKRAKDLFALIEPFTGYGFNKAHAASYAVVAYQTAYMKANYTVEFMCAVMTAESGDTEKIAQAVAECERLGIQVLSPDINRSNIGFTIESDENGKRCIRFGLSAIKNVGEAAIHSIIQAREEAEFSTLNDFCRRVNLRTVNKKTFESLIKAGAMDRFGRRQAMLDIIDSLRATGQSLSQKISEGQGMLFEEADLEIKNPALDDSPLTESLRSGKEATEKELLAWEKEFLGLYLTRHPIAGSQHKLTHYANQKIASLEEDAHPGAKVKIGGIISTIRRTFTKAKGEEMAFLKLEDETGTIDIVVFPKTFSQFKSVINEDAIIILEGKLDSREEETAILAEIITDLSVLPDVAPPANSPSIPAPSLSGTSLPEGIGIIIPKMASRQTLHSIYEVLKKFPGQKQTFLLLEGSDGQTRNVPVPFGAELSDSLINDLLLLGCKVEALSVNI